MQHNNNDEKPKQPYEKPKLRKIELAAEEVLVQGCKSAPGLPGSGSTCTAGVCHSTPGS